MWDIFSSESEENLLTIEQTLLEIEKKGQSKDNIDLIYRALHTFKGNTRVMGLTILESVANLSEDLMGLVRDHQIQLDQNITDILLFVLDNFRSFISEIKENKTDIDIEKIKPIISKLQNILKKYENQVFVNSINDDKPIFLDTFRDSIKTEPKEDPMFLIIYFDMIEMDLLQLEKLILNLTPEDNNSTDIIENILLSWIHATERMKFYDLFSIIEKMLFYLKDIDYNNLKLSFSEFVNLFSITKKEHIISENDNIIEETIIEEKPKKLEEFLDLINDDLDSFSNELALLKKENITSIENIFKNIENMMNFSFDKGFVRLIDILEKLMNEISLNKIKDNLEIEDLEYELFSELASLERNSTNESFKINNIFTQWHAERIFTYIIKIKNNIDYLSTIINNTKIYESNDVLKNNINEITKLLHFIYYTCRFYELDKLGEIALSIKDIYLRVIHEIIMIDNSLLLLTNIFINTISNCIENGNFDTIDYSELNKLLYKISKNDNYDNNKELEKIIKDIDLNDSFKEVITSENLLLLEDCLKEDFFVYIIEIDLDTDNEESNLFYNWLEYKNIKTITSITLYKADKSFFQFLIASKNLHSLIKKELEQILINTPFRILETNYSKIDKESNISTENYSLEVLNNNFDNNKDDLKLDNSQGTNSLNNFLVDKTYLRISQSKINQLMDLVGEISLVTGAILTHSEIKVLKSLDFHVLTKNLETLMSELQEETSNLGLVPVSDVFKRMQRLVRDLTKETGKNVNLQLFGEDTEIDKAMVEKIYEPLVHILRNAVDHGLEHEEERVKLGKKPIGTIKLKAYNQSSEIIISIEDDGKGLDRKKILDKAIELNFIDKDNIPDDKTIFNYIFSAGFSTANKVSSISGRGVGMDVVKHSINELKGRIAIESKENHGTIIQLRLPLTLAFIEGMIVRVNEKLYAIPIISISEVFKLEEKNINNISANKSQVINIRNNLIPTCWLQNFYNEKNIVENNDVKIIVVVNSSKGNLAIPVDQLLGNQQLTQKPLMSYLKDIKAGAGYGLLSSGEVAIILDCERLYAI